MGQAFGAVRLPRRLRLARKDILTSLVECDSLETRSNPVNGSDRRNTPHDKIRQLLEKSNAAKNRGQWQTANELLFELRKITSLESTEGEDPD